MRVAVISVEHAAWRQVHPEGTTPSACSASEFRGRPE